jgi:hypothetical protein
METDQIVQLLISERDKLSRAIEALGAPAQRRGRPRKKAKAKTRTRAAAPSVAIPAQAPKASRRKRKPLSAARRKALSAKMKAYWEKRKKTAKS